MLTAEIKTFTLSNGADLVGIADLTLLKERFPVFPPGLLDGYHRAVSFGIGLDRAILEGISGGPTEAYADHYRQINRDLDDLADLLTDWIKERGQRALTVPASDVIDKADWRGSISHRAVGRLAGLGWSGKSLMLINPDYGPSFRLATVLTDMDLTPDAPMENRCGSCTLCTDACVAGAILDRCTETFYEERSEALDLDRCVTMLKGFKARPEIGAMVCGVCIKACPYGKSRV